MHHRDPIEILVEAGYRRLTEPIRIEDVALRFDDVLIGPGTERDLILVERKKRLPTSLARLTRALLAALETRQSWRPVSLVVVSEDQDADLMRDYEDIRRICPVYIVTRGADALRVLRPLLPLVLPTHSPETRSADVVLSRKLGEHANAPLVISLLSAARDGSAAVDRAMLEAVDDAAAVDSEEP
ncbi:hypothetical protein [Anaeromyxobacter dehalogenans]|uniref:hypothetical protein n=1 Tax=Anaeromyxobacter dehalogenans TaxID=161493 RepID=UPI00059D5606|nr:hypothetical protein [Anaeromyxobacter dehalogenans]